MARCSCTPKRTVPTTLKFSHVALETCCHIQTVRWQGYCIAGVSVWPRARAKVGDSNIQIRWHMRSRTKLLSRFGGKGCVFIRRKIGEGMWRLQTTRWYGKVTVKFDAFKSFNGKLRAQQAATRLNWQRTPSHWELSLGTAPLELTLSLPQPQWPSCDMLIWSDWINFLHDPTCLCLSNLCMRPQKERVDTNKRVCRIQIKTVWFAGGWTGFQRHSLCQRVIQEQHVC